MRQMKLAGTPFLSAEPGSGWAGLGERWRPAAVPLALGAILLMATALRLWHLGTKPLWFDETWSVFIARQPLEEIPRLLRLYDTHPPLYYLLLHFWMGLFGTGEVAVRLPGVLASVVAVGGTFFLAQRVAGARVALLAAFLLAVSPFQVTAAQEARTYPFITLFGVGAAYALWRALEDSRSRYWLAYAGCLTLAIYTHHFSLLLVPAYGAYVLLHPQTRAAWRRWILWTVAAGLTYLPIVPVLFIQYGTARGWPEIRPAFDLLFLTDVLGMFDFGGQLFGMGTYYQRGILSLEYRPAILLPFLFLVAAGVWGLRDTRKGAFLLSYWTVPVLITAGISLHWHLFFERYFSFVLPPFAILTSAGVLALAEAARPAVRRVALAVLLAYLLAFAAPSLGALYGAAPTYDWRAAGRYVTGAAQGSDFVLYVPAFTRIPFEYYFEGPQARMGLNPQEVLSVHRQAAEGKLFLRTSVDPRQMGTVALTHPRMWMVTSVGLGTDVRAQLAEGLAPFFRRSDERMFGLVAVSLWESRLYGKATGR